MLAIAGCSSASPPSSRDKLDGYFADHWLQQPQFVLLRRAYDAYVKGGRNRSDYNTYLGLINEMDLASRSSPINHSQLFSLIGDPELWGVFPDGVVIAVYYCAVPNKARRAEIVVEFKTNDAVDHFGYNMEGVNDFSRLQKWK
jgi:hypothetical protein